MIGLLAVLMIGACRSSPSTPAASPLAATGPAVTSPPQAQSTATLSQTVTSTPYRQPTRLSDSEPDRAQATLASSPTPAAGCLDDRARAIQLPSRQFPLEVRFSSAGNIWVWSEGSSAARQVSETGNAEFFSFGPYGENVVFMSAGQTELWTLTSQGSDLRQLLSADLVQNLAGDPPESGEFYTDSLYWQLTWIEDTQRVGFEILRAYEGLGGCCESRGHWQVDIHSGQIEPWTPPERPAPPAGLLSPDGQLMAVAGPESLSIADADGVILQENALAFGSFAADLEFAPPYPPTIVWAGDSQSLIAIVLLEDLSSDLGALGVDFAAWWVPVDGSASRQVASITALPYSISVSPGGEYLAYLKRSRPRTDLNELHLARTDGSQDMIYDQAETLAFWGWAPDGIHFIFGTHASQAPLWGSVCDAPQPLFAPPIVPAEAFAWVDAAHLLFVSQGVLHFGQVGGTSISLGPLQNGYYTFDRDEAALGGQE